jgi:hypothetical protein
MAEEAVPEVGLEQDEAQDSDSHHDDQVVTMATESNNAQQGESEQIPRELPSEEKDDGQASEGPGVENIADNQARERDPDSAATKIQQRARGMNDRKKVAGMKERGQLPGQIRLNKVRECASHHGNKRDIEAHP